jgi:hypothetical protein
MMEIKKGKVLMAYKEDIKHRGFLDWMKAHTSFVKPLHRYEGNIILSHEKIMFDGKDTKTKNDYAIEINKMDVTDIYLGFDDVFKRGEDRSLGISFQPLRIIFSKDEKEYILYLIIDFNRLLRASKNKEWYEELKKWRG